jgi:hypothetical protein
MRPCVRARGAALALAIVVSACGGPEPSSPPATAAQTPGVSASALSSASPEAASPERQPYALGISVEAGDYGSRAFANIFKNDARVWVPGTMKLGPVDEQGMPTTDFDLFTLDGAYISTTSGFNGTYTLYFNGLADVALINAGTIQDQHYDAAANLTTMKLVLTERFPTIAFQFTNTRRTSQSELGTGVTGLKLMRPISVGSSESYPPDAVFTTDYLAVHARGQVLRFMDFTATNGNAQHEWADRNTPDDLTFYGEAAGYWWQGKGAPWEYAILLANTLDKDIWINVPTYASDDYVDRLAGLLKATLEPDRKVYVEYSNELWNFGFPQWDQVTKLVDTDVAANANTSIDFDHSVVGKDGKIDYGVGVPRYWARRVMQISDIFRAHFGDQAMMSRVRPLFETQAAWQHWISMGLLFLDRYYDNADGVAHVTDPRPVNSYIWGGGGSGYVHGLPDGIGDDANATIDDIFAAYEKAWPTQYDTVAADVYWTSAFGLRRVAYEAGPGIDSTSGVDVAAQLAQIDPRIESVYKRAADVFFEAGGDLYVTFLGVNPTHGLVPYDSVIGAQPTPKLNAFDSLLAVPARPVPTVGYSLPSVIHGGRYHVRDDGWSRGDSDGPVRLEGPYAWVSYTVTTRKAGRYAISLDTAETEGGVATLLVDGVPVKTAVYCPNGGTTDRLTVTLSAGVHGIRVLSNAAAFDLVSVRVDPEPTS